MGMKLQHVVKAELEQLSKEDAFLLLWFSSKFYDTQTVHLLLEVQLYGKQLSLIPKVHSLQIITKATHFERLGSPRGDATKLF